MKKGPGDSDVHCIVCDSVFSCASGGINDCKKHVGSQNHTKLAKIVTAAGQISIKVAFAAKAKKDGESLTSKIVRAEAIIQF